MITSLIPDPRDVMQEQRDRFVRGRLIDPDHRYRSSLEIERRIRRRTRDEHVA